MAEHSDSELFDNGLSIFWNFNLTGIADTPCRRSPFALTFSEVTFPEFWRLPQNSFVSSVRLQPCSACQNAHLFPSFRFSIDGKEHVGGCQLSKAFPFEQYPLERSSTLAGFSFLQVSFLSLFLVPRNSVAERWRVENPFLFPFGFSHLSGSCFHSTLISSRALTFLLSVPLLQLRQRRAFQDLRNVSHEYWPPSFLKSGALSRCTLLNCILQCTARVTIFTKISRISSSGCFFIAILVSSHSASNDCMLFFHSTFLNSLRSQTDSTVSLKVKYSQIIHETCLPVRKRFFVQLLLLD